MESINLISLNVYLGTKIAKKRVLQNEKSPRKSEAFGAENEARTRDPNLGKVVLYQLSYFRIK